MLKFPAKCYKVLLHVQCNKINMYFQLYFIADNHVSNVIGINMLQCLADVSAPVLFLQLDPIVNVSFKNRSTGVMFQA